MDRFATLETTAPIGAQLIADLRSRIIRGALPPGMRLSEQEIARGYDLSRQPVREAFIKLSAEQLVEIRPQRGTFVRKINLHDVTQSQFVREAVEADIVRLAATFADAGTVADLRGEVALQRDALTPGDTAFIALDERFHQRLAEAARRSAVWTHIQPIKMQMDRVRHLTAMEFPLDHLVAQHAEVTEAIARGDADGAEAAIRRHLREVLGDVLKIAADLPHYFDAGTT